jgi:MarR family transcriptional regulator for hemolysin
MGAYMLKSLDESIGMFTSKTSKKIIRFLNTTLEKHDITAEQWNVLLRLSKEDSINQKQLSCKVDKDQPTVVRILDILERKGLIERKQSLGDRRAFIIQITEKGMDVKEDVQPLVQDAFKKMMKGISREKIDIYIEVLMKINDNIMEQKEINNNEK